MRICHVGLGGSGFVRRVFASNIGVTAIEYGLIAALIAIVAVVTMKTIGTNVTNTFNTVAGSF
jgi:pilus assembly protein Flp/PilA